MRAKILHTGHRKCGKTTLIREVISQIPRTIMGFFTQEMRSAGRCVGFDHLSLNGQQRVLAHVGIHGRHRVGKFGVDTAILDELAVSALYRGIEENSLIVIDEIGPMEILSIGFRKAVLDVLESLVRVLGTIVRRSISFTDSRKARSNIELINVQLDNREKLVQDLIARLFPGRVLT